MTKILHEEDDQVVVELNTRYGRSIMKLLATISPYSVEITRLSDIQMPQSFRLTADEMKELAESWNLFQQKQTEKTEAQEKANEDARMAEEKRMEAVKEEVAELAKTYGIIIEELDNGNWQRLLLPNGEKTKSVQTIDELLKNTKVVVRHMEIEKLSHTVEEHTQVL